jgi:hypothetical protein
MNAHPGQHVVRLAVLLMWVSLVARPAAADFIHTATATNTRDNYTYVDPAIRDPQRVLTVTPLWGTGVRWPGVYNDHPIGVWFDTRAGKWAIFNEDLAPMPLDATFYVEDNLASGTLGVHRATAVNVRSNFTYIDHPLANGNPNAVMFATQNWNPGGRGGVYNNRHIGVWYDAREGRWAVFNQDRSPMPVGAAFNLLITTARDGSRERFYLHRATAANTVGNVTYVSNDAIRYFGAPEAPTPTHIAWWRLTANWNAGGGPGVYNNHAIGVWFDRTRGQWAIFNQDGQAMPIGSTFNIEIAIPPG